MKAYIVDKENEDSVMVGFDMRGDDSDIGSDISRDLFMKYGGDIPEPRHITLVYLGKKSEIDHETIVDELTSFIKTHTVVAGKFSGLAVFEADEDGRRPIVMLFDSPQIAKFREDLLEALGNPVQKHGFTPHMTLLYTDWPGEIALPELSKDMDNFAAFGKIVLFWGKELDEYFLSGDVPIMKEKKRVIVVYKGGKGSGFRGHKGRRGLVGGSSSDGNASANESRPMRTDLSPEDREKQDRLNFLKHAGDVAYRTATKAGKTHDEAQIEVRSARKQAAIDWEKKRTPAPKQNIPVIEFGKEFAPKLSDTPTRQATDLHWWSGGDQAFGNKSIGATVSNPATGEMLEAIVKHDLFTGTYSAKFLSSEYMKGWKMVPEDNKFSSVDDARAWVENVYTHLPVKDIPKIASQQPGKPVDVKTVFEALLLDMRTRVSAQVESRYAKLKATAESFVGQSIWDVSKKLKGDRKITRMDATNILTLITPTSSGMTTLAVMSPKADSMIAKWTMDDVNGMFASFIAKQVGKTQDILKGRTVKKADASVGTGLEGKFHFELSDGAKFDMTTMIVWKVSPKGNLFWQFPTTFHNAFKADGTKIAKPSEAIVKAEL